MLYCTLGLTTIYDVATLKSMEKLILLYIGQNFLIGFSYNTTLRSFLILTHSINYGKDFIITFG